MFKIQRRLSMDGIDSLWKNPKVDNRIISDKNNVNACTLMSKIYFKTVET